MNNQIEVAAVLQEELSTCEPNYVSNVISLVPSKNYGYDTASAIADSIIGASERADASRVELLAMVSCLSEAFQQAKDALTNQMADLAIEWPENTLTAYGVAMTRKEVGVKYNYSEDSEWQQMQVDVDSATKAFKDSIKDLLARQKGKEAEIKLAGSVSKMSTRTISVKLL